MGRNLITLLLSFTALSVAVSGDLLAADATTMRVENGVTIKSGTPPMAHQSLAPEKRASEKKESFPVQTEKPKQEKSDTVSVPDDLPPDEDFEDEKIMMNPVYEKDKKATATKKEPVAEKEGPFKKSVYSGVSETVKKPDPKPEVSSKPLPDSISDDIKSLEKIKKAKTRATNAEDGIGESGLKIPRFVSLKSGEANARTGPGDTYPIRWVYQRKNLPLEVTAEFKLWRRIKDFDGEQSWVHQALLSSRRYAILLHDASGKSEYDGSAKVARFKKGVQVKLIECKQDECQVEYGNFQSWLKKKDLWGVYNWEVFD